MAMLAGSPSAPEVVSASMKRTPPPPSADPPPPEKRDPAARTVAPHQVLLAGDQVASLLGLSAASFYRQLRADPTFPKAVRLTPTATPKWIRAEVEAWVRLLPRVEGSVPA